MNIKNDGLLLDYDLLGRLAGNQASGATVSQKEAKAAVKKVKSDLKKNYKYTTSKSSFTRAEQAISNTFAVAIKSGWVKGAKAKDIINDFVQGSDDGLKATLDSIREAAKNREAPRSSYSSYNSSSWGS